MNKITIFPQWGGYKIKVNGNTVGAAPAGNLKRAKELALIQAKNLNEREYDILDENKKVVETIKIL